MNCASIHVCLVCTGVKVEKRLKEKGKESLHFPLSNPRSLSLCVSAPSSLFLISSLSRCQSSLSFSQFVFHLKITYSCLSNVDIPFRRHLSLPSFVSIHRHLVCIVLPSYNLQCVYFLWWLVKQEILATVPTTNFQTHTLLLWPNFSTQEWVISCKI